MPRWSPREKRGLAEICRCKTKEEQLPSCCHHKVTTCGFTKYLSYFSVSNVRNSGRNRSAFTAWKSGETCQGLLATSRLRPESIQHLCEPRLAADGVPCGIKLQLPVVWAAGRFGKKHQPFHRRINIAYPRVNHCQMPNDSSAIHSVVADRPQLDSTASCGQCLFLVRQSGIDEPKHGE